VLGQHYAQSTNSKIPVGVWVTNHVIPFSQNHLAALLSQYKDYFNNDRTHRTLKKDSPVSRANNQLLGNELVKKPRVGQLHHRYLWNSAA
jgi:hypothetical protein